MFCIFLRCLDFFSFCVLLRRILCLLCYIPGGLLHTVCFQHYSKGIRKYDFTFLCTDRQKLHCGRFIQSSKARDHFLCFYSFIGSCKHGKINACKYQCCCQNQCCDTRSFFSGLKLMYLHNTHLPILSSKSFFCLFS